MDSTNQHHISDTLGMEAAFEYPNLPSDIFYNDSINKSTAEITETFLNQPKTEMLEELLYTGHLEWMSYLVLGMLALIAMLWYFVPDRLISIYNIPEFSKKLRSKEVAQYSPGLAINAILSLNFIMALSMFSYFVLKSYFPYMIKGLTLFQVFGAIAGLILILYLIKYSLIMITGFTFNTRQASKYQNRVFSNTNNLLGILLLPLLFFLTNWTEPNLLIAGIILVISAQILKWYSSFFIVISSPGIFVFHFIVYLCTLEIIPLVVIIKLLNSSLA